MGYLVLKPGGTLVLHYCDEQYDVSESAVEYLFDLTILDEELLVRDIYLLLRRNPVLFPVLRRFHAQELVADAFSAAADPYLATYDPDGIEYFELSRNCWFNADTNTFASMNYLEFDAVGWELRSPFVTDHEYRAVGERRTWEPDEVSPRTMLNYPLRFTETSEVMAEGASYDLAPPFKSVCFGPAMLGQIIESVIGRLGGSFQDENDEIELGGKRIGPSREPA
ncbi:MAG: hypothetical protein KAX55_03155 [Propionivibrio sp.]|nr:hypothetical protein [Propionivibrio sp.]